MARQFTASASEYLSVSSVPVTDYPFTMAAWGLLDSHTGTNHILISMQDESGFNDYQTLTFLHNTGEVTAHSRSVADGVAAANSTGTLDDSGWHHGCGVWATSTSRTAYIDGSAGTTETTSVTFAGTIDGTSIGAQNRSSVRWYLDGKAAEIGVWNVALTQGEIDALAAGVSPLLVRTSALVFYDPVIRGLDADGGGSSQDIVGGLTLAESGTDIEASAHPPIYYASRPLQLGVPAAAAGLPPRLLDSTLLDGGVLAAGSLVR